jgi:hypothetical protein
LGWGILTKKGEAFMAVVKWWKAAAEIMLCQTNFIYDGITEKCRRGGTLNKGENVKENNNNNNNN